MAEQSVFPIPGESYVPVVRRLVRCAAAVALSTGVLGATWATSSPAGAATPLPVVNGHRCTKVTRVPHAVLRGTPGNDVLCGLGGYDTLIGGRGNDILIGKGAGNTASFADHATSVDASLVTHVATDPAIHQKDRLIGIANLVGGTAGDVLIGNGASNVLVGGAGNDELKGGAGNDTLSGGVGNDWLVGGTGTNHLLAGSGSDTLDGSDGLGDIIDCGTGVVLVNVGVLGGELLSSNCDGDVTQELQRYHGTVSAIDADANTISVQWSEVNDTAQSWLDANGDPNPVTISLTDAVVLTASGQPLQPGDQVEVEATTTLDGSGLTAVTVRGDFNFDNAQFYVGLVVGTDPGANTISVEWLAVSDAAQTWLDAHGDPNPVTISLAGANVVTSSGGPVQPGDIVAVEATSPTGTGLVAVNAYAYSLGL